MLYISTLSHSLTLSLPLLVFVVCVSTRESTHYSFTPGDAVTSIHQSVYGDPDAPGSARSREHTHTHTGHYTHSRSPDERERARGRERRLSCLFRLTSTLLDGLLSPAGPCHPPQARTPISGWRRESWGCWHGVRTPVLWECAVGKEEGVCNSMSILYMCKYLTTLRWQQQSEDGWGALCANSPLI